MNRQEFRLAYRAARKATAFYGDMRERHGVHVNSMFQTMDMCPGFTATRLHGDMLTWIADRYRIRFPFRRNVVCHRNIVKCLKHQRKPRLPA